MIIKIIIKAVDGGVPSEIEYRNEQDEVIAYWAYGSYDPVYPPLPGDAEYVRAKSTSLD